ncbi:E3 ubiquitin-protein ligase RNF180 isoform X3 [Solea solea]|uniref:E3 ubiquitin-protein ligase RNF180 isoform X3 n=1 Tax=Solea solea TaxID=90069 RepID=UPI00272CB6DC|nr:E3 ubiquitin-protein ligase RNF180 isoform X3 [Solea solea]
MMLRCRKCRKGVIDSTCLTTEEATDEGSAAVCSIWHVNVDALPQWILTSLHQAQWTVGKLKCLNCGARLGGFNFVNRSKCPCGRDANVHLSKSRVDSDHKHNAFIVRPRDARLETSLALPPTGDSENNEDSLSVAGPSDATDVVRERPVVDLTMADRQTDDESTLLPVSRPSTQETDTDADDVVAVTSLVSGGRQLQTVEAVESSVETTTVHQEDSDSTLFLRGRTAEDEGTELRASSASRSLSRREKNRLKSQRRKQRRRERWLLSQQQADVDSDGEEEEKEKEKEEDRENLTCTVCLDVYFRPHSCEPCGHVFCELCLRTLAKNRHTKTTCPLCRTLISHTDLHTELDQAAKTSFPKVYLACQQNFTNALCAKWPLPSGRKRFWGKKLTKIPLVFMLLFRLNRVCITLSPHRKQLLSTRSEPFIMTCNSCNLIMTRTHAAVTTLLNTLQMLVFVTLLTILISLTVNSIQVFFFMLGSDYTICS